MQGYSNGDSQNATYTSFGEFLRSTSSQLIVLHRSANKNITSYSTQAPSTTVLLGYNGVMARNQDSELDTSIPCVNPATAHFHISLLRKFEAIYNCLEHGSSPDEKTPNLSLQSFLALAESRYFQYLGLLSDFAAKFNKKEKFANVMPLPPW
jgi:hypothetical protein